MIKKLTHHGNSVALIIDKPIMELLNITVDTPLEITTDGKNLVISPVHNPARGKKVAKALKKVNSRHRKTLKRLAE